MVNNEMTILKRLYLGKGLEKNTVSIYVEHLKKLSITKLNALKLLFVVYQEIVNKIINLIRVSDKNLVDKIEQKYELDQKKYESNEKISRYVKSRFKEENLEKYLNSNWQENLKKIDGELMDYSMYELIDIYVKAQVMKNFIETYILIKDEYWYPSNLGVVLDVERLGYNIEVGNERIWQPKS